MRSVRIIPSLALLLLLAFPWACAQDPPPRLEVFLEGGGSFLTGSSGQLQIQQACPEQGWPGQGPCPPRLPPTRAVTNSFSKTARLFVGTRLRFTRHDALEASYSYSPTHFTLQPAGLPALFAYNRNDLVTFSYVRYLWTRTRVQPFITTGFGISRFSGPSSTSAAIDGFVSADNGWQFAWIYGGGADLVLRRDTALRMELRDYVSGLPAVITGTGHNITGTNHNVVPSVGIVFRFK